MFSCDFLDLFGASSSLHSVLVLGPRHPNIGDFCLSHSEHMANVAAVTLDSAKKDTLMLTRIKQIPKTSKSKMIKGSLEEKLPSYESYIADAARVRKRREGHNKEKKREGSESSVTGKGVCASTSVPRGQSNQHQRKLL